MDNPADISIYSETSMSIKTGVRLRFKKSAQNLNQQSKFNLSTVIKNSGFDDSSSKRHMKTLADQFGRCKSR